MRRFGIPKARDSECHGSISAYAEVCTRGLTMNNIKEVHLRICGGLAHVLRIEGLGEGPSPHMRRFVSAALSSSARMGSISAYAEVCPSSALRTQNAWVHLRICGGLTTVLPSPKRLQGPSPHMRRFAFRHGGEVFHDRSISAYAEVWALVAET